MAISSKKRASKQEYSSPNQCVLFKTPFTQHLDPTNRWVILAQKIPWDIIVGVYQSRLHNKVTGASGINPRVAVGAIMIKHITGCDDREVVMQIQESPYLQFFLGLSCFTTEQLFDPSLFVEFRKRLGVNEINRINEQIVKLYHGGSVGREPAPPPLKTEKDDCIELKTKEVNNRPENSNTMDSPEIKPDDSDQSQEGNKNDVADVLPKHEGKLIIDATACPQDIRFPTDLDLLNDAREKSEELIDVLFNPDLFTTKKQKIKPRTYREKARIIYLKTAQKKQKTKKEIRKAIKQQLNYLKRNLKHIDRLWASYDQTATNGDKIPIPLDRYEYKYLLVIRTLYWQQLEMWQTKTHQIDHRIVSIHQPHVRPIVRGKTAAKVEFGAKLHVSLMNGFSFIEDLSWEAFNESSRLLDAVERYKKRFGYYPKEVLADKIYCTRENRRRLKVIGIMLKGKPLGKSKAVIDHVRPGERNPIEGVFGQAKAAYGLNRIKARLAETSESWIASIIMVLNLVKLTRQVPYSLFQKCFAFSARNFVFRLAGIPQFAYRSNPIELNLNTDFFSRPYLFTKT